MSIRSLSMLLSIAVVLAGAGSASAVSYTVGNVVSSSGNAVIVGNTVTGLTLADVGETVSFDITIRKVATNQVSSLGASVSGYDLGADGDGSNDSLGFSSGLGVASLFANLSGFPILGLTNMSAIPTETFSGSPARLVRFVMIANNNTTIGLGDGSFDVGVDSIEGGPQARLTFEILGAGITNLAVGTVLPSDSALMIDASPLPVTNDSLTVVVTPEPGTVLLVGMGLAALATRRPNRR